MKKVSLKSHLVIFAMMLIVAVMSSASLDKPEGATITSDTPTPCEFLKSFYTDYILGGRKDFNEIASDVCTTKLLKFLQDSYEWDCDGVCYDVSCFRTDNQDGTGESVVTSVTAIGENRYKVEYLDMGHTGVTYILFAEENGTLKMDEISKSL